MITFLILWYTVGAASGYVIARREYSRGFKTSLTFGDIIVYGALGGITLIALLHDVWKHSVSGKVKSSVKGVIKKLWNIKLM